MTDSKVCRRTNYEYSRLGGEDPIRLLKLLPGEQSEAIRCQLTAVSLSDNPEYEALSYVWGDASEWFEITCEEGTLKITQSKRYLDCKGTQVLLILYDSRLT